MDIRHFELSDADDFTSYTDSNDSRIRYTYAKFSDSETGQVKYGCRVTKYKEFKGGEAEVGVWSEVSERDFVSAKNTKR